MSRIKVTIVACLAALLALMAPAVQAQVCKVGIKFTCLGNGNGTLSVSCRPGETGGACCRRHGREVRRLCNRVGNGLASQQCNYLGTSAGTCGGSGGTTATPAEPTYDPGQLGGSPVPGMLSRPCPRVTFNYVCTTGRRGSDAGNCPRGNDTKTCCKARLSLACGGAGLVDSSRSTCKCLNRPLLKRRR